MSPSSPKADSVSTLIFSGGEIEGDYSYETKICEGEHLGELCNLNHDRETGDASDKKVNVYVRLFEGVSCIKISFSSMLNTRILRHARDFDRDRDTFI